MNLSFQIIGPLVAIAVNLPLALWALARKPHSSAHRAFALLGISLVLWLLGGQVPHAGVHPLWLRLSYLGMALVPANFLYLALALREKPSLGAWWRLLIYLPAAYIGLTSHMHFGAARATVHTLAFGFYDISLFDEYAFASMAVLYLGGALAISFFEKRQRGARPWVFNQIELPLVAGVLAVMAVSYVHNEHIPMVSYWAMAISQYAMFLMIRHNLVPLGAGMSRRGKGLVAIAVAAAGGLLLVSLSRTVMAEKISQELGFIIVVAALSVLVLYAALVPRMERYIARLRGAPKPPPDKRRKGTP